MARHSLDEYSAKRRFTATPEPAPRVEARRAGPLLFVVQQRFPMSMLRGADWRAWVSVFGTNAGIAGLVALMIWLVGVHDFLMVQLPIIALASSIGVWLFYIQHQFEETLWETEPTWNVHEAALQGSSHYDLPGFLPWLTANIGYHHVHHVNARVPFYRLPEAMAAIPELQDPVVTTLAPRDVAASFRLKLWDPEAGRMVAFHEVHDAA